MNFIIQGKKRQARRMIIMGPAMGQSQVRRGFVSIDENGLELEAEWRLEARSVSLVMSVSTMPDSLM